MSSTPTAAAGERPTHRHHTPRYYAHRVKDSFTTRLSKRLCSCFLCLLLVIGVILFITWLRLRPHRPRFHLLSFSIAGLNQENGFLNAAISFNVSDRNPNESIGIYYDNGEASVFYREQRIGATVLQFPDYQNPKSTTYMYGMLNGAAMTADDRIWREFRADMKKGSLGFRLELRSGIRFKVSTWDSRRHRLHASCYAAVGSDGQALATSLDKRCSLYFT